MTATTVREPPSSARRAAPNTRRATDGGRESSESIATTASRPASTARLARSMAISAIWACSSTEPSKAPPATVTPASRRHSVTSSGRTPASTTIGARSGWASASVATIRRSIVVAPAPGGPAIATREPLP